MQSIMGMHDLQAATTAFVTTLQTAQVQSQPRLPSRPPKPADASWFTVECKDLRQEYLRLRYASPGSVRCQAARGGSACAACKRRQSPTTSRAVAATPASATAMRAVKEREKVPGDVCAGARAPAAPRAARRISSAVSPRKAALASVRSALSDARWGIGGGGGGCLAAATTLETP
jgi:hypothetical protein